MASNAAPAPVRARVLADFEAEMPGELTVSTQDEVLLVVGAPVSEGWSLVIRGEESGLVPTSYVEPLPQLSSRAAPAIIRADFAAQHDAELSVSSGDVVWLLEPQPTSAFEGWTAVVHEDGAAEVRPGLVPTAYLEVATAMVACATFDAEEDNELSVSEGQLVWRFPGAEVEGWSEVLSGEGVRGLVPASYIEEAGAAAADGGTAEAGGETPAESVSEWLTDVMALLAHAEDGVTLEATALADFEPEADVEMRLRRGETIALLQGVAPPDGWAVALRRGSSKGARPDKGLVPATYVELLPFEAVCAAAHGPFASGERVRVDPRKSSVEGWWASKQAEGGAAVAEGGGGLVPRALLKPLTAEDVQAELRQEAALMRKEQEARREAARREAAAAAAAAEAEAEAEVEAEAADLTLADLELEPEPDEGPRRAAEERQRREAEERTKREAAERARREAAEVARKQAEAEAAARREAEVRVGLQEKARREEEERERARREAEEAERRRQEAVEKVRRETEEAARRRRDEEEAVRREAEARVRQASEERARQDAEAEAKREAAERTKREAAEVARWEVEERQRKRNEERRAMREAEERAQVEAEERQRRAVEEAQEAKQADEARRAAEDAAAISELQAVRQAAREEREARDAAAAAAREAAAKAARVAAVLAAQRAEAEAERVEAARVERTPPIAAAAAPEYEDDFDFDLNEEAAPAPAPGPAPTPAPHVPAPAPPVPAPALAPALAPAPAARLELHLEVGPPGMPSPVLIKREHSRWSPSPPPSPQWEYTHDKASSPVAPPSPPVIAAAPAAAVALVNAPWHELGLDERLGLAVSGLDAATWDSSYMAGSDPRVVRPMEVPKPVLGQYAQGAPPPKPRESIASRAVRSLKDTERPFARRAAAAGGGGGAEAGGGQGRVAGAEGVPRDVPRHPKPRAASASVSKRDTADKAAARARQAKEAQLAQKAASDAILFAAAATCDNPAAAAAAATTVPVKDDRVKLSTRAGAVPVKGALPQLSQSAAVLSQQPKSVIGAASAAVYGALRPKRGPGHRTPARAASAAALGPRTPPCNENTAALIHAFTRGALAGDRLGERSQLVRRLESEALAMAKGAQLTQGSQGARPASSPPGRPVTAPSLGSLGGSPAL